MSERTGDIYLRDCKACNRKACNKIGGKQSGIVSREPIQNGHGVFQQEKCSFPCGLVLELTQRFIVEENLFDRTCNIVHQAVIRRNVDLVHQWRGLLGTGLRFRWWVVGPRRGPSWLINAHLAPITCTAVSDHLFFQFTLPVSPVQTDTPLNYMIRWFVQVCNLDVSRISLEDHGS